VAVMTEISAEVVNCTVQVIKTQHTKMNKTQDEDFVLYAQLIVSFVIVLSYLMDNGSIMQCNES
jgi:hypothetical protein